MLCNNQFLLFYFYNPKEKLSFVLEIARMMKTLGNIVWLLFGGLVISFEYLVGGTILCLTIIGIPFGIQAYKLAWVALWPFGRKIETKESSSGCISILLNVIWLICGGIWIAVSHLIFGIILAITIVGIPFAGQHVKLAGLALSPFGKEVF